MTTQTITIELTPDERRLLLSILERRWVDHNKIRESTTDGTFALEVLQRQWAIERLQEKLRGFA